MIKLWLNYLYSTNYKNNPTIILLHNTTIPPTQNLYTLLKTSILFSWVPQQKNVFLTGYTLHHHKQLLYIDELFSLELYKRFSLHAPKSPPSFPSDYVTELNVLEVKIMLERIR